MIDLYYAPTPNGWKATIMLEECGIVYTVMPVNLRRDEQHLPGFLELNPNGKIPVIVDHAPAGGGVSRTLFESGAILLYLAEKTGLFLSRDPVVRDGVIQWLMWQVSGLGPMLGQNGHFKLYAPEKLPYAIDRFRREAERLYGVLDRQLEKTGAWVVGEDYTIADIAIFPWLITHKAQGIDLTQYPSVKRWFAETRARPAVMAGTAVGKMEKIQDLDIEERRRLFGGKEEGR